MKRVLLSNRRPVTGKIPKDIVTCDLTAYGSQQTLNAKMIMKRVFVTLKKKLCGNGMDGIIWNFS